MDARLRTLNAYLAGWLGYYGYARTPSVFKGLDEWTRRRLRACVWKEWNEPTTRYRRLKGLGLTPRQAFSLTNAAAGIWRQAGAPLVNQALDLAYWRGQGLACLSDLYRKRYA